jgi:hypothetical protein
LDQASNRGCAVKKVCLVLALLLCCALALWMTGCGKTTVTGTVTYKDGSPAVGKMVVAIELYAYRAHNTRTDSAGRYVFEDASPGEWQIYVLREYRWSDGTPTYTLRVKANQENILDIPWPY